MKYEVEIVEMPDGRSLYLYSFEEESQEAEEDEGS